MIFQTLRVVFILSLILYLLVCLQLKIFPLHPRLLSQTHARDDTSIPLRSIHTIVDPSHSVPEPNISFSNSVFDGWFGVPFQNILSFTHIRSLHPSEISTLYRFSALIIFYPIIVSSTHIRSLVLRILPLHVMKRINHTFFSHISPQLLLHLLSINLLEPILVED